MSSHDCSICGGLDVKEGVSEEQVREAIQPFLTEEDLPDFDEQMADDNIEFDGVSLSLSIDFLGNGGYHDDSVDALIERLETIVDGHAYLEVMDYDTGDQEGACVPYFIACDDAGRQAARLEYGIMQMADYVTKVIGKNAFEQLSKHILALPRLPVEA